MELASESGRLANWSTPVPSIPSEQAVLPGAPDLTTYARELELIRCLISQGYDDVKIQKHCPYLLVEIEFNSVLQAANSALGSAS